MPKVAPRDLPGYGKTPFDPRLHPAFADAQIDDADAGVVTVTPRRKRVAIVGFSAVTRDAAPYDDPSFEIWGLNQLYRFTPRFDRWFELHTREVFLADTVRDTNYLAWLQTAPVPIYMIERFPDIPTSVRFPIEVLIQTFRRDYFTSSIALQFAFAILLGFEEIHAYGIDLVVGGEYGFEKPCAEYWLGQMEGRGIKVVLPKKSALLKQHHRYGYEPEPDFGIISLSLLNKRYAALREKHEQLLTNVNALEGAMQENRFWADQLGNVMRGAAMGGAAEAPIEEAAPPTPSAPLADGTALAKESV
jgi:hypothetical protein